MNNNLQDLIETDKQFSKLSEKKGPAEAFKFYLVNDAIMLPNNQSPVFGIADISSSMELSAGEVMTWEPKGGKVDSVGEIGYTWGTYNLTLANNKKLSGKYLNVWEKQEDNSWKVIADIGNNSPS